MKCLLLVALVGAAAAQSTTPATALKQNGTAEATVNSADGRRHRHRHRDDDSESYEDEDWGHHGGAVYAAAPAQAYGGYGQQAAAPAAYGQPAADPAPAYGAAPAQDYGYQQQQYAPAYPQYPVYASLPPNFDVNYCSIHASFPMTGGETTHRDDSRDRDHDDDDSDDYSRKSSRRNNRRRGDRRRVHRRRNHRWNRQTCRFTATFSQETCQSCCRVSSRNTDSDMSTISGALMFFAPWDEHSNEGVDLKRQVQCVCCAPRRPAAPPAPINIAVPVPVITAAAPAPAYPAPVAAAPTQSY